MQLYQEKGKKEKELSDKKKEDKKKIRTKN